MMALPLFIVPTLLKNALAATGALGAKLGGIASGRAKAASKGLKSRGEQRARTAYNRTSFAQGRVARKSARESRSRLRFAQDLGSNGPRGWIARGISGKDVRENLQRRASAEVRDEELKDINSEATMMSEAAVASGKDVTDQLRANLDQAIASGDSTRARAAIKALKESGDHGVEQIQDSMSKNMTTIESNDALKSSMRTYINSQHSDLKQKDARITNWAGSGDAGDINKSKLSGLDYAGVASQTTAALKAATASGALSKSDALNIINAANAGTISIKGGKLEHLEDYYTAPPSSR